MCKYKIILILIIYNTNIIIIDTIININIILHLKQTLIIILIN